MVLSFARNETIPLRDLHYVTNNLALFVHYQSYERSDLFYLFQLQREPLAGPNDNGDIESKTLESVLYDSHMHHYLTHTTIMPDRQLQINSGQPALSPNQR